ncbi:HupE/UreJ family protein [Cylindrospermum sp. FACHB-282]|uniref:HupE/UreJ family protein n=1 Tax=Cylindrospermum sp. FACHB-282 TaxID=2692794 RepID=UPI0016845D82|nr:HupE/UreJ family protein [Cylindrospermum sp. FACHB-282]MBD2385472.1 HupE/UreJ family protein [Cylindrospermum sp. FACHB-282]
MFKIELSPSSDSGEFTTYSLQHRHIGAITALVLISLLSSLAGTPAYHAISNCWEGFIWGIADPVMRLERLALIVAIGLLSAGVVRSTWMAACFAIAAVLGTVIYLSPIYLPNVPIAIAIFTIAFGAMLIIPIQLNWVVLAVLGIIAGLFQGYANGESVVGLGIVTSATYLIGVSLTQLAIVMSAREIGLSLGMGKNHQPMFSKIRLAGLAFCSIGIVFLGN